jgi:hypothetical protein
MNDPPIIRVRVITQHHIQWSRCFACRPSKKEVLVAINNDYREEAQRDPQHRDFILQLVQDHWSTDTNQQLITYAGIPVGQIRVSEVTI